MASDVDVNRPTWLRFLIFFALMMVFAFRKELLAEFGYADAGWPRWIFAGALALGFMLAAASLYPDPVSRSLASRSQMLGAMYKALSLIVGSTFLFAIFARLPLSGLPFWIAVLPFIPFFIFDIVARRALARQAKSPNLREA
jgi:hypothetical protein